MAGEIYPCSRKHQRQLFQNAYNEEVCGICKTADADSDTDRSWFSPHSRRAHDSCIKQLERHQIEEKLNSTIQQLYANTPSRWNHLAHSAAIEAVEKKLDGRTIQYALKQDGAEKIKQLFDTNGVRAAELYQIFKDSSDDAF